MFGSAGSSGPQSVTTGGIMMMIPCYVFFGSPLAQMNGNASSSNFNAIKNGLQFYGFISEWSVNYTHFTSSMVPIRAAVSVNFTMLPTPPTATQTAVWKDLKALGQQPYTVASPYAPGYSPTSNPGGNPRINVADGRHRRQPQRGVHGRPGPPRQSGPGQPRLDHIGRRAPGRQRSAGRARARPGRATSPGQAARGVAPPAQILRR